MRGFFGGVLADQPVFQGVDWLSVRPRIKTAPVIERSPMRLGHLDQYSMVVQILGLALIILMLADALPRRKSQRNVVLVAVLSLLAGLLTVPLLNWAAFSTATTFVMWVVLILLWSAPIYSVLMHHDNTALTVALALLALVIFDLGVFALPAGLAPIFGATWTPWQGVTGFGGWLQLIMAFRFGEVILTTILFTTMLVAIYLAHIPFAVRSQRWVAARPYTWDAKPAERRAERRAIRRAPGKRQTSGPTPTRIRLVFWRKPAAGNPPPCSTLILSTGLSSTWSG